MVMMSKGKDLSKGAFLYVEHQIKHQMDHDPVYQYHVFLLMMITSGV